MGDSKGFTVSLTWHQLQIADWAAWAMLDYALAGESHGEGDDTPYFVKNVPERLSDAESAERSTRHTWHWPEPNQGAIDDFLYRVTVQYLDMARDAAGEYTVTVITKDDGTYGVEADTRPSVYLFAEVRKAETLANKIRKAWGAVNE